MVNANYIVSVVKVLETPKQKLLTNNGLLIEFRAFLPQVKKNKIVKVFIWSELSNKTLSYLKKNDYILTEGFLSSYYSKNSKLKKFKITALKIYPILLSSKI